MITKLFFYILSPILLILIIYGFQLHTTNGFEKNYFTKLSDSQKIEYRSIKSLFEDKKNNIYNDINFPCKKWNNKINLKSEKKYESCEKKFKKSLIILGDSHGLDVFNSISKVTKYDFVYGIGTPGCRVFNQSKCNYEDYFNFIKKNKNSIQLVLFVHQGSDYLNSDKFFDLNMKKYNETLRFLNRMSKDLKVVWFGVNPEPRINSTYLLKKQDLERFENKQIYNLDKYLKKQNNMEFEYFSRIDQMNYKYLNDFKVNSNYTYSDGIIGAIMENFILEEKFSYQKI